MTRPAREHGDAEAALPVAVLLAAKRDCAAVRPAEGLGAVVRHGDDDGDLGIAEIVQLLERLAVMLDHAVGVDAEPGRPLGLGLEMRQDVHPGRVQPDEEGLLRGGC
jgi:hypothetical protein